MDLPVSVNTLGSLVTLGLGVFGLLLPHSAARFVGVTPDPERGLSEIRATYGGLFLAMGLWATIAQDTEVFRALGIAWMGAAAGRSFSVVRDGANTGANFGGIAMEATIGLTLLVPWDLFFGA